MLISSFQITGLHGYKDVTIDFNNKSKIIVAENGSGKTTILNALNALLTCQFKRLSLIEFDSLKIEFFGGSAVELFKSQLNDSTGDGEELAEKLANDSGVSPTEIINFVKNYYTLNDKSLIILRKNTTFRKLMVDSPFTSETIIEKLDSIRDALLADQDSVGHIKESIENQLRGVDVVFLPTYRRVELPLNRSIRRRRTGQSFSRNYARHDALLDVKFRGMNFGLSDVEVRLSQLADEVERRSNSEYRIVSARMVNELLQSKITQAAAEQYSLPDIDALEMFLSRLDQESIIENASALRRFYESEESNSEQHTFLRYFLGQLSQVIDQTRAIEEMLREFVDACNQYLKMSSEEKSLSYVPESMKVEVRNSWTGTEVALDALSSGEKQIISLLAKLYLEPSRKLILIDEPEISLSLDWQKRILSDVARPESVVQFLAITHSPFVFDNDLAEFACPLNISRNKAALL